MFWFLLLTLLHYKCFTLYYLLSFLFSMGFFIRYSTTRINKCKSLNKVHSMRNRFKFILHNIISTLISTASGAGYLRSIVYTLIRTARWTFVICTAIPDFSLTKHLNRTPTAGYRSKSITICHFTNLGLLTDTLSIPFFFH